MILGAGQPYFSPFPGFFARAIQCDVFVLLDRVQFPRGTTWLTRNRFKNDQGLLRLTVPVRRKGLGLQSIDRVRILHEGRWCRKHLSSLATAYRNSPYFTDHMPFLRQLYQRRLERLVDFNTAIITHLAEHLDVETRILRQSEIELSGAGTELLTGLCRAFGADKLLAPGPAKKYIDRNLTARAGIQLIFFDFPKPVYPQMWGPFIPNLSAFDLLFNCGPRSRAILMGSKPSAVNLKES